jgi:hypothetical protein
MLDLLRGAGKTGGRKLLLFAVAISRRVQHLLTRDYTRRCSQALGVWDRFADGLATDEEVQAARSGAYADAVDAGHAVAHPGEADFYAVSYAAEAVATLGEPATAAQSGARAIAYEAVSRLEGSMLATITASWEGRRWWERSLWDEDEARVTATPTYSVACSAERAAQADLLRDIFGPLIFRSVSIPPFVRRWSDSIIVKLATAIYEERSLPEGTLDNQRLGVLADALEEAGCTDAVFLDHLRFPGPHVRGCWAVDLLTARQ